MTKQIRNDYSKDELNSLFKYVKASGKLYWRKRDGDDRGTRMFNTRFAGTEAGWFDPKSGYVKVFIAGRPQQAHRLIWTLLHGPTEKQIDHKDGDRQNNRPSNLREATPSNNSGNQRRRRDNRTGYKGVKRANGRFVAQIRHMGEYHYLGVFDSAEMAHSAYVGAARVLHGEFARAA